MPIVEARELSHVYSKGTPFEKIAIDHVNLCIDDGECVGLIGHTGSGKSTLIQHFNALLKPTEGTVLLQGQDIFASKAAGRDSRKIVGLVFQYPEYQLFGETVYEDIAFGPRNQKLSEDTVDRRVRDASVFTGVEEDWFARSPLELSGGQKRRVAIAGVLAMEPRLLILDEPAAGLDPEGRESILRGLLDWKRSHDATLLLVTHDMSAAATFCDRLLVMTEGRLMADDTPAEIFAHSEKLRAAGLDLPPCASLADRLRENGLPLPNGLFTIDALTEALLALKKDGASC